MDPLSAMRWAMPQVTAGPADLGAMERAVPRRIPAPEVAQLPEITAPGTNPAAVPDASFDSVLGRMVGEVSDRQSAATDKMRGLLSGQDVSLHETMIAIEEANLSFQLMVEVRNKLLESYQELMRMQI